MSCLLTSELHSSPDTGRILNSRPKAGVGPPACTLVLGTPSARGMMCCWGVRAQDDLCGAAQGVLKDRVYLRHTAECTLLQRRAVARARSFWGPDGEWDWDADPGQIWVLLAAGARGACVFEAFSNSPPFWMTASGRASGAVLPFRGNLRREREPDFVAYLVRVLAWFRDEHGFTFRCAAASQSCAGVEAGAAAQGVLGVVQQPAPRAAWGWAARLARLLRAAVAASPL